MNAAGTLLSRGIYRDVETGLYRMGARDYALNLGRFLSRDPSGYSSGPNVYVSAWMPGRSP